MSLASACRCYGVGWPCLKPETRAVQESPSWGMWAVGWFCELEPVGFAPPLLNPDAMVKMTCTATSTPAMDRCCRAIVCLLDVRNRPDLPDGRRRAIARRLIALCDQLQAQP